MAENPPPMPPQTPPKPNRQRNFINPVVANRIILASTARHRLTVAEDEPQEIDKTVEQP